MSIPLDRLYHYIESVAQDVYGDTIIYHFYPHGSKKIEDLNDLTHSNIDQRLLYPEIICYDQEPLDYNLYQHVRLDLDTNFKKFYKELYQTDLDLNLYPIKNLRSKSCNLYDKCILLHSEKNSTETSKYSKHGEFLPVYYWSHGIIAQDWFRYAKHLNFQKSATKDFLIYNRAWSGTRQYRLKFIDLLVDADLIEYCNTSFNPTDNKIYYRDYTFNNDCWIPKHNLENYLTPTNATSNYSADFNISDYQTTNVEVVLETLYNDQRWHLTEKTLRPIACKQPFILVSTPGSLEYLKSYGFKTYNVIFDETYDTIQDPIKRLQCIIMTMQTITKWSICEKQDKLGRAQEIANYNHQHFFSDAFFSLITDELKTNLSTGLNELINTTTGKTFLDLRNAPGLTQFTTQFFMSRNQLASYIKLARKHRDKSIKY